MVYCNKSALQGILAFSINCSLFFVFVFSWQGRALTKTSILKLIRSLEKMEIPCYLCHIINLDFKLCWKKKNFLLKKLSLETNFFSSLKFQNIVRNMAIFIPTKTKSFI